MNPMTNVKNIQKLNETELALGNIGKKSWHDQYKDSAWIFIGGLPYDLTEGDVLCVFSQYGEIVNINLVRDNKTGKSKGFAFICYEDQRSTILAVDNLNSIKVLGRTIRVDHVENYKPPKEYGDEDELTKKLHIEGCAPVVLPVADNTADVNVKTIKKEKSNSEKKKKKKKDKDKDKKRKHKEMSSSSEDSDHKHKKKLKTEKLVDHDKATLGYEKSKVRGNEVSEKKSSDSLTRTRDSLCSYDSDRKNPKEKYQRESHKLYKNNADDTLSVNKDRGKYQDENRNRDIGKNRERESRDEYRSRDGHRDQSREKQRSRDMNDEYKRRDSDKRDRYDRDRR